MKDKTYTAIDKVIKPAFWFSFSLWIAAGTSTWLLVKGLGRFQSGTNPTHVVIVAFMAYFTLAGMAFLAFVIGSWMAQSKVLWLLPPLPRWAPVAMGIALAGGWFVVELLRPLKGQIPSWVSGVYFIILPGFLAAGAELIKARFSHIPLRSLEGTPPTATKKNI